MARSSRTFRLSAAVEPALKRVAAAALICAAGLQCSAVMAQAGSRPADATRLDTVTVTGRTDPVPSIAGWGDVPLAKTPFQASIFSAEALRERGMLRLSDITRLDPAVSDAYNTEGYWDSLTVRGFVIDNRFNYRRDGLPINAETSIPLDNKDRIEVLKGTSGLQAGTSAPGGLVNLIVKRPLAVPLRSAQLGWREKGSWLAAIDLSQRFGPAQALGLRLNAAVEHLEPKIRDARGNRRLLALAGDWQATPGTLIEAEVETSHKRQPSAPGFSLLGDRVPAPVDPRINLNNQPWSLPVVLDGDTASLRVTQKIGDAWRVTAHAATQRLTSHDRIAFPFGCFDPAPAPDGRYYGDRYCPDGSFDLYDFRSDNERRRSDALEVAAHGGFATGGIGHRVSAGLLRSRVHNRFQRQTNNYVGSGTVDSSTVTPADPTLTDENTDRDERSTEVFVRDTVSLGNRWTAWLGVRHSRLRRDSVRTDGSRPTGYEQSFTKPWLAASFAVDADTLVYASWSHGSESEVTPNRARYVNGGQALPALKSRQIEVGIKADDRQRLSWGVAAFAIDRPAFADVPTASGAALDCQSDTPGATCTRRVDGSARHRGIEADVAWRSGPWLWQGGVQWLHARRLGSVDASVNGARPVNVPAATLKLSSRHDVAAVPGLSLRADLVAEGDRMVLPDNSARIPGYARIDASLRFQQRLDGATLVWRAGIDNLFDRRAWREAPYQFGHAYLFPLAARTLRLSLEALL